ncbi:MAG: hypothetical protein IPP69_15445 [Flavobacteriales bacterium]|nr:hypothetical protein [Flavobacteriales bacterium]
MKATLIKSAFILSVLATIGAITLAASKPHHFTGTAIIPDERTNTEFASTPGQEFYSWIQHHVHCPEFVKDNGAHRVEVWIQVQADGTMQVVKTSATDSALVAHVQHELNGAHCPYAPAGSVYHFAIQFKRIA